MPIGASQHRVGGGASGWRLVGRRAMGSLRRRGRCEIGRKGRLATPPKAESCGCEVGSRFSGLSQAVVRPSRRCRPCPRSKSSRGCRSRHLPPCQQFVLSGPSLARLLSAFPVRTGSCASPSLPGSRRRPFRLPDGTVGDTPTNTLPPSSGVATNDPPRQWVGRVCQRLASARSKGIRRPPKKFSSLRSSKTPHRGRDCSHHAEPNETSAPHWQ